MYTVIVVLLMLVLPAISVVVEHLLSPDLPLMSLLAKWYVFWAVGVRLGMAGLYFVLGLLFLYLVGREILHGPDAPGIDPAQHVGRGPITAGGAHG